MKKITLLSLVMMLLLASALHAQSEKGTLLLGGNSSFDLSRAKAEGGEKFTTFNIRANAGYFLMDNLSAGITGAFTGVFGNYAADGVKHTDILSEFRYYFTAGNFRPFVSLNGGYRYARLTYHVENLSVNTAHGPAFGGGIGGAFFVRNNISIDLGLKFLHANLKRSTIPYGINGPIKEEKPFRATMNDLNILIGFSLYL